tara:strand:+ start:325 stop:531 length:207 start_codon:yes stop_codon:yes gene_type:complete
MPKFRNKTAFDKLSEELQFLTHTIDKVPSESQLQLDTEIDKHIEAISTDIARIFTIMQDLIRAAKEAK